MASVYQFRKVIYHEGLKKSKEIKATYSWELENKIRIQMAQWDEQWKRKVEIDEQRQKRLEKAKNVELALKEADVQTQSAKKMQNDLDNILMSSIESPIYNINFLKKMTHTLNLCLSNQFFQWL